MLPAASAAGDQTVGSISPGSPQSQPQRPHCPYAHLGLSFYRGRFVQWTLQRGASIPNWREPRNCADAKYLANVWESRARQARQQTIVHLQKVAEHTLHDFVHTDGSHAWARAVREVQRAYPGTESWLMSCSASEGGWGRWVPNSGGSGVGGWMQFMPGTWSGFFWRARADVQARGFVVPESAASWYSTLGQALAGAWGITHGMRHHWAGGGCQ